MSKNSESSEDLPLMSNTDYILVEHYILFLQCIFERKIFNGKVYVIAKANYLGTRNNEFNKEFRMILDSKDIEVKQVEEIILDLGEEDQPVRQDSSNSLDSIHPFSIKTTWMTRNALNLDTMKRKTLHFHVDKWSLQIWKEGIYLPEEFPQLICITYQTKPSGASITWTRDQDDRDCCYTHGAWINNRSLLPCQEPPIAMATWQAFITAPRNATVVMSGDYESREIHYQGLQDDEYMVAFRTRMKMPMATLAIAIGFWKYVAVKLPKTTLDNDLNLEVKEEEYCYVKDGIPPERVTCRIISPPSLLDKAIQELGSCLNQYLQAATDLLGPYPFQRLDIVIMPRCYDSLGMASPNVTFLSPSVLTGDGSMCVHLAHEVSHAWFGLLIGALDWTEEWLSEGFATYMEDLIHARALLWDHETSRHWSELRTLMRYRTLVSELQVTTTELQTLRPNKEDETKKSEKTSIVYIKHGMNAEKRFMQVHYLKGYFLLKYLSDLVGEGEFTKLLKMYISQYHGQLVHSQEILKIFFDSFPNIRSEDITIDTIYEQWLNSPGLPKILQDYTPSPTNILYKDVLNQLKWWKNFNKCQSRTKRKPKKAKTDFSQLSELVSEQTILLLELLLEESKLYSRTLQSLHNHYALDSKNANIRHRWCELVIKFNYARGLPDVQNFLFNDQGMGVYLYGELILSEKAHLQQLAKDCWIKVKDEMSPSASKVVREMLNI